VKVMVTGGAGFIGSHLVQGLLQARHEVVVVDNLSSGNRNNITREAEFLERDVSCPDSYGTFPTNVDVVCHLAAQSAGAVSAEKPYYDFQTNAGSTLLLTRWCLRHGIQRLIYASSMAVYGSVTDSPVREDAPCVPVSYYGVSKLSSEHLLRMASREGLKTTAFRIFTAYGPAQDLDNLKQGMVSIYLAYLLKGVPIPITGSLGRFRDFIYVDDVVEAWRRAVEERETPYPIYNLGTGRPTTVRELLEALKIALDLEPDYPIEELRGSPTDQFGLYADVSRLRKDLSCEQKTELRDGLRTMVAWARTRVAH